MPIVDLLDLQKGSLKLLKNKKTSNKKSKKNKGKEKKAGWRVCCLLQPTLNPGDLIYLESKPVTGWFKIESLKHTGEYRGKKNGTLIWKYMRLEVRIKNEFNF